MVEKTIPLEIKDKISLSTGSSFDENVLRGIQDKDLPGILLAITNILSDIDTRLKALENKK